MYEYDIKKKASKLYHKKDVAASIPKKGDTGTSYIGLPHAKPGGSNRFNALILPNHVVVTESHAQLNREVIQKRPFWGWNAAGVIGGGQGVNLAEHKARIDQQLRIWDVSGTAELQWQNGNLVIICDLTKGIPQYAVQKTNLASKILGVMAAYIGDFIGGILRTGVQWNVAFVAGGPNMNIFHTVYSIPKLGLITEINYGTDTDSYMLHAFIRKNEVDDYSEYTPVDGIGAGYSTAANLGIQTGEHKTIPVQHGDVTDSKIGDSLYALDDQSGDTASMVAAESARFAFLRGIIGELSTDTYLIFGNYAIQLKHLMMRYGNIRDFHYPPRSPHHATSAWKQYSLSATKVSQWLDHYDFAMRKTKEEVKGGKYRIIVS